MNGALLYYDLGEGCEAFSTSRDCILPYDVITANQVHRSGIAVVDRPGMSPEDLGEVDALITDRPGLAVGVRTADCVPILLYDPEKRVVAAVHAGWRGTVQMIPLKTVSAMQQKYGCRPEDIKVAIGPSIGRDSFQVGEEVVENFKTMGFPLDEIWFFNKGKGSSPMYHGHHINLVRANEWILSQAGIRKANIRIAEIDTYTDENFFSARREGVECGRIVSAVRMV